MRIPARLHILPGNIASVPEAEPLSSADADEVERILADENLRTVLQPIVRLQDRQLLGFEALSRGPLGSTLERPDRLFAAAGAAGLSVSAELICARLALERTRGRLNHGQFLTINLGPAALLRAADVLPLAGRTDVVFELTEHLPLDAAAELRSAIDRLHQLQLHTALDDTGCGFADLRTAEILRPGIVKLCITPHLSRAASNSAKAGCTAAHSISSAPSTAISRRQKRRQLGARLRRPGQPLAGRCCSIENLDVRFNKCLGQPSTPGHPLAVGHDRDPAEIVGMLARELDLLPHHIERQAGHLTQIEKQVDRPFKAGFVVNDFLEFPVIGQREFAKHSDVDAFFLVVDDDHGVLLQLSCAQFNLSPGKSALPPHRTG